MGFFRNSSMYWASSGLMRYMPTSLPERPQGQRKSIERRVAVSFAHNAPAYWRVAPISPFVLTTRSIFLTRGLRLPPDPLAFGRAETHLASTDCPILRQA